MDWNAIESKIDQELLPTQKAYSVVKLETNKPPDHPECAAKAFEVDDLHEVNVTGTDWVSWIAYDEQGNSYDVR